MTDKNAVLLKLNSLRRRRAEQDVWQLHRDMEDALREAEALAQSFLTAAVHDAGSVDARLSHAHGYSQLVQDKQKAALARAETKRAALQEAKQKLRTIMFSEQQITKLV